MCGKSNVGLAIQPTAIQRASQLDDICSREQLERENELARLVVDAGMVMLVCGHDRFEAANWQPICRRELATVHAAEILPGPASQPTKPNRTGYQARDPSAALPLN